MKVIAYSQPLKYGVLVFDITGEPVQDRQRCANTIKQAHETALKDMKEYPFSCAAIYRINKHHEAVAVKYIDCAGKIVKNENSER